MKRQILCVLTLVLVLLGCQRQPEYDICIYGGSSAGVIAAYTAKMKGKKVLLIEPSERLGGLSSGGLGFTDIGNKQVINGLSKDFYRRIGDHYGKLEQWIFEPSVAETIFNQYIKEANIEVLYNNRIIDALKEDGYIKEITLEDVNDTKVIRKISAHMFIDCSYEGDLMAKSRVSYVVGRESNEQYNETYNGVQLLHQHQFPDGVDPYKIKGDPSSGLLWGISDKEVLENGTGDTLVQAYNYRICLTNNPSNKVEITRPENYDSTRYDLLVRLFEAQPDKRKLNQYFIWSKMPNNKTDVNNRGGFSTDVIGLNYNYPNAGYEEREQIIKQHKDYTQGLLYFYKTDPRVPKELQDEIQEWGYPKDEYTESEHWSPQLYVRESRRMIGEYVMTQAHCEGKEIVEDGIGMAAYQMDSHNCQRIVIEKDGKHMVKNEGNVEVGGGVPYPISYRSLTPKVNECKNLLSVVTLSASHIAYGSIRMEPVFMVLAQSAALGAVEALKTGSVQTVDIDRIRKELQDNPYIDRRTPEILVDDSELASVPEGWDLVERRGGFGSSFLRSQNKENITPVRFEKSIENTSDYAVYTYYHFGPLTPSTVHYTFFDGIKEYEKSIDKKDIVIEGQTSGEWISLGTYRIKKDSKIYIDISGQTVDGKAVADAILLIPNKK